MRKTFQTEAARIVTMIILLMSTVTKGLAQSPYALFGDNSKMLEATEESVPNSYGVLFTGSPKSLRQQEELWDFPRDHKRIPTTKVLCLDGISTILWHHMEDL